MEFSSAAACPLCAQQCTEDTSTHTHTQSRALQTSNMQTSAVPLMLPVPNPFHSTGTTCGGCVGRWPPMQAVMEQQDH